MTMPPTFYCWSSLLGPRPLYFCELSLFCELRYRLLLGVFLVFSLHTDSFLHWTRNQFWIFFSFVLLKIARPGLLMMAYAW